MIVIIDHYDSFTYNLVQYVREMGYEAAVVRTDKYVPEVEKLNPSHVILSPGPGHPKDVRLFRSALHSFAGKIPILGVCLGHQAIANFFRVKVVRNFRIMHGKTSHIEHRGTGIFQGLPNGFEAVRYHSLIVDPKQLNQSRLNTTAWTSAGEVMAIEYIDHPNIVGVQFHPESCFTEYGKQLLFNFLNMK